MELTFLHDEKTSKRVYKHFTINGQPAPATSTEQHKLEFFYIGKKADNIGNLINAFESGYAAESVSNAKSMLRRLLNHSKSTNLPDIIIVEAPTSIEQLRDLHLFLLMHRALLPIPVVVEASNATQAEIQRLKNYSFIDEIIFLQDYNRQRLLRKVSFLKKLKHKLAHEMNTTAMETALQVTSPASPILKRAFDILISGLLLLALSPIFLLIALAIRIESKGSIFYIAKRAGRGYKIFDFFKFRTMFVGADAKIKELSHLNQYSSGDAGAMFFKINNDPRITKVGLFLRNTSLDELPQLVNVLIGDMSLVGNRPLPLYEAASLTTDEWAKRFMAPAGMTGLWQIKKRGKEEMSIEERLNLDIDYADRFSFMYDLWIMANTPSALIQRTNA
ncbi:sugar transferase [Paraflavitalea sp. CAU 1676]|uniref:sugar transferase n=1 Tax=Paraflavitalea sp. CAU 1676 TaxID=3032598 RepID=UPI0023DB2786|nr:sugar transferase [Paraflavitalea sp. CAU 1676]MDF2187504.1 sugar transferase [Paraflavitalea sp. CAU 1676]